MKLRERIWLGLLLGLLLALLLNVAMGRSQELAQERQLIAESGYRYVGVSAVPEDIYTRIYSYTEHFQQLGYVRLFEEYDDGTVEIQYNFLSRDYYPGLMRVELGEAAKAVQGVSLLWRVNNLIFAPGLLIFVIVAWPWVFKEFEVNSV